MGTHRRRLGEYRLLDEIGRGSTAVVYLAMDSSGREVAVKELCEDVAGEPEARRRLAAEMAAQGRVRSAYVARLLDGDVAAERPYVVSQYVPGCPLGHMVSVYGPLEGARLVRFARWLALALADVHDAGVLHRDVTPRNVILLGDRPTLIDFGIAHAAGAPQLTRRGFVVGTPAYLAPELIEGEKATIASDVYSWAATVAFAATGRPPFGRGVLESVCYRILRGEADLEGAGEPLATLLKPALRREPGDRPSARWFAGALATWGGDPPVHSGAPHSRAVHSRAGHARAARRDRLGRVRDDSAGGAPDGAEPGRMVAA